jgi:hypothetical protein
MANSIPPRTGWIAWSSSPPLTAGLDRRQPSVGARIGNVALTAAGGTPGNGLAHGAIRRWTARRDGFIAIDGNIASTSKNAADAVRGWIVSSGTGLLGTFSPQRTTMPTRLPRVLVKRGDTIDFVVVGKGSFAWPADPISGRSQSRRV